jgi:glycosyltransferase involved in cell wall biosynthesis
MLYAPSRERDLETLIAADAIEHSLIIPVYRNEENIPSLLQALGELARDIVAFEVVFVIDGSPDRSAEVITKGLAGAPYAWQLAELSRNFGSFAAIRQGLALARGRQFAVMAADLQEPPQLIREFFDELDGGHYDVVVGVRGSRADPAMTKFFSRIYWQLYSMFVMPEIPRGGVDVFGCNRSFRDALLSLEERNSFLIGQIFWLGFRRHEIIYERRARTIGSSAWKFRRRLQYMLDSLFAFSDLPISLLLWLGALGVGLSMTSTVMLLGAWSLGFIDVRGYVPIMLALMFFGSLLVLGQGIIGCYVWRVAENTKKRPLSVILSHRYSSATTKNSTATKPETFSS